MLTQTDDAVDETNHKYCILKSFFHVVIRAAANYIFFTIHSSIEGLEYCYWNWFLPQIRLFLTWFRLGLSGVGERSDGESVKNSRKIQISYHCHLGNWGSLEKLLALLPSHYRHCWIFHYLFSSESSSHRSVVWNLAIYVLPLSGNVLCLSVHSKWDLLLISKEIYDLKFSFC